MNWPLLQNSLLVAGVTAAISVALGFCAALCLAGLEARWRNPIMAISIIALALPPFLVTNCWLHFLGQTGVWRSWLPINIVSLGGTVWILSLLTWPISLLLVWSAWRRLEAAQLEIDPAVTGWALVRSLLFPLARTSVAQATVLTFVLALSNFAVPAILQVKVFPAEIWVRFSTAFDTLGALRLSWPLVIAPLVLLAWFARREVPWPRIQSTVPPGTFRRQLGGRWFLLCSGATIGLCAVSVGLPLYQLASTQRTWTELPGALAAGQASIWNSFFFAAISAAAIAVLSLAGARPLGRRNVRLFSAREKLASAIAQSMLLRPKGRAPDSSFNLINPFNLINSFLWLPFLLPGVLLGIALIFVFNRPGLSVIYQSATIVVLAFVIRYFAIGWTAIGNAGRAVDPTLTDAARLDGASRWQMLRYIVWPQIASQVLAIGYIIYLLCLWDVESIILIYPPGSQTLALNIFNFLHYGHNAQVNALCVTLLVLAVVPLGLWQVARVVRSQWSVVGSHRTRTMLALFGMTLLFAGCSPQQGNEARVNSQLFAGVKVMGSRGVGVGELNKPRSVAVDVNDNLYVVDMTGRVQKFSPNGAYVLSWQMPQTDLGKPKGMCRDGAGDIVVVEPHYQRVNHFSPEGKLLAQWGERGTNAGQFMMPRAAAVDSQNEIFVSEYGAVERVQKFRLNGDMGQRIKARPHPGPLPQGEGEANPAQQKLSRPANAPSPDDDSLSGGGEGELKGSSAKFLAVFGHAGTGPGEFNRPEGLCVDKQDRLYVADSCNHRIQIFDRNGKFIRTYGKAGTGKGELSYPYDICVDAAGRQYVCEFGNSRIQVFDAADQPLEILGGPGAEPGRFSNPWGVALDSAGNLYVADSQNHRVQKFVRKEAGVRSQESVTKDQRLATSWLLAPGS